MEFSVRVVDEDDNPREDVEVTVFDHRHFWSTSSLTETTDSDGVAHFDCDWQFGAWDGSVKIFAGNQDGEEYTVNDGYQFTVQYPYD